jgi:acid phosphatase type 7
MLLYRLLAIVAVAALAAARVAAGPFSKSPYIQFPTPDTVTVMWEGTTNMPGTVRFGPGQDLTQTFDNIIPVAKESRTTALVKAGPTNITYFLYKASIPGLLPHAVYSYQVAVGNQLSEVTQFRTLDPHAQEARFIVYGDSRSDPKKHRALAGMFAAYRPEFVLHTGDLVAKGQDYSLWSREFFEPMAAVIDRTPFFSVIGNHEQDGTNYLNYFDLPGNELWYSLDAGPVHVLALDFRYPKTDHPQFRFAEADLKKSHAAWKIVILHTPIYNIGGHASNWGHENYLPLFHKTHVDLVLAGHSHMYERFRPLAPRSARAKWAITHITTGGGGANLHNALPHPSLFVHATTNHFVVFEANAGTLKGTAVSVDGSLIDAFQLSKVRGKLLPDYLEMGYDQESLDLFFVGGPLLGARAAAAPNDDGEPVQFTLASRPKAKPLELRVRLSESSSQAYELLDAPLTLRTPRAGFTDYVTVQVRSRGSAHITTNSSKELVPPLSFEAEVTDSRGSTLVYGPRVKVGALVP